MKRLLAVLTAAVVLAALGVGGVQAKPAQKDAFKLPAGAQLLPDGGYSLGKKTDPTTGKKVDGIAYLQPKKQSAKVTVRPGGGTVCYGFIANGLKWKTVEPWLLDANNSHGLTSTFLMSNTTANVSEWESAAGANIFGTGSLANGLSADEVSPDGQNEVLFGSIDSAGTIAVTIVWGYYSGPAKFREIVEWDQIFDDEDYDWSATGEAGKMDYDNISTHEVGHAAGMSHPSGTCTEETMYAYADFGETKKRDLNPGDKAGISALY